MPRAPRLLNESPGASVAGTSSRLLARLGAGTLLIVLAGAYAFFPALRGDFVWDDYSEIVANKEIQGGLNGLRKIWVGEGTLDYFPLKSTVQWLQWQAWGERPFGYHVTSLALHLIGALLVWRLFAKLGMRCAWVGGFLFAIHPLATESVAWIAELKNVLSLPPLLWAACCYLEWDETRSPRRYVAALALFVVAMLCKTSVVMFPLCLLLHAWWRRGRICAQDFRASVPFFAAAFVLGLVTVWFQHERAIGEWQVESGGLGERLGRAGLVMAFYFWKSVAPVGLLPIYPRGVVEAGFTWQLIAWLALGGVLAWCWHNRQGWGRHALLGLGWFLLNLLPVIGLIKMSFFYFTWVSDHFAYLSLIGIVGLLAALASYCWPALAGWSRVSGVVACLALGALAIAQTRQHAARFTSEERLWRFTLQHNPQAWLGHSNLAASLLRQQRHDEALKHALQAVRLKPNYASAHFNVAAALVHLGNVDEALAAAARADAHAKPSAELHLMLASGLLRANRIAEAIEHCEIALRVSPEDPKVHQLYAVALFIAGRAREAIPHYEQALRFISDAATRANYGVALAHAGRFRDAIAQYEQALQKDPASIDAHYNYGIALAHEERLADAQRHFEQVLRLNPTHAEAHYHLGVVFARTDRATEAVAAFRAALRLKPDFADAQEQLRLLQARGGNP